MVRCGLQSVRAFISHLPSSRAHPCLRAVRFAAQGRIRHRSEEQYRRPPRCGHPERQDRGRCRGHRPGGRPQDHRRQRPFRHAGVVDMHTHLFHTTGIRDAWAGDNSVQPDAFSFRSGVTTMVDAGSSGWRNFETFRHTVIDRVRTRVLAMINITGLGMMADVTEQVSSDFQPKEVAAMAAKHKDVVVGVKSAHYQLPDWLSVDRAIEAGALAGLPVMVDFGYFVPERPY